MDLEDRLRAARNPALVKKQAPDRITISAADQPDVPGSPVALVFEPDQMNRLGGSEDAWVAELPWESGVPYYRVYRNPMNDTYVYMRPADPDSGAFSGTIDSLDDATRLCAEDVVKLARRQRWKQYMLTHEPPKD